MRMGREPDAGADVAVLCAALDLLREAGGLDAEEDDGMTNGLLPSSLCWPIRARASAHPHAGPMVPGARDCGHEVMWLL